MSHHAVLIAPIRRNDALCSYPRVERNHASHAAPQCAVVGGVGERAIAGVDVGLDGVEDVRGVKVGTAVVVAGTE